MKRAILEKGPDLRRRILLIGAAGVPVLFLRFVNDPINVPKLALLFGVVVLAGTVKVLELLQGADPASLKRAWLPAAAIVVPLTIGWIASPYKGWALLGFYDRFQGLLPYVAVALSAVLVADSFAGRVADLAWAVVVAGGIVGAYGMIQVAGLDPLVWARAQEAASDAGSTIGNPNFAGGFLAMTLPFFLSLWLARADKRRIIGVLGVCATVGWVVTFSQGAWAAGMAGVAVALGIVFAGRVRRARAIGVLAASVVALAVTGQVLLGAVSGGGPLVPGTVLLRAEAWKGAVDMATHSPVLGRGPNAYAVEGTHHRTVADALRLDYDYPNDPHSVILAMLTGAGILGAVGFVVVVAWIVVRGRRIPDGDLSGAAILGGVAAYLVQSLVSIDELSLRSTFWILLGGLGALTTRDSEADPSSVSRKARKKRARREPLQNPVVVAGVAVVGLIALIMVGRFFLADVYAWRGLQHARQLELNEAEIDLQRAIDLRHEYEYRRLWGLRVGALALRSPESAESFVPGVTRAFRFLERFPHVSMHAEKARILRSAAIVDEELLHESLATWERAHRLDPLNPLIVVEMSAVLEQLDRPQDARAVLEPYADDVGDRFPQYWGALALMRALTDDPAGAENALARAVALDPQDPWVRTATEFIESHPENR